MTCNDVVEQEIAEKYLLGRLDEAEREAYEQHYFACDRCMQELQTLQSLRAELARRPLEEVIPEAPRAPRWWRWVAVATAAVVLVVGGLQLLRKPATPPAPQTAERPAPATTREPDTERAAIIAELARVYPPPYERVVLRGPSDEQGVRFHTAMDHYLTGRYGKSTLLLREVVSRQPQWHQARFYLGASYLLAGQVDRAIPELERVARSDSEHRDEARFYLAKAYVRSGQLDRAGQVLSSLAARPGAHQREAQAMLETMREHDLLQG